MDGFNKSGDGQRFGAGGAGHEGGAVCGHYARIGNSHAVGIRQLQILQEHLSQFGQEGERTAAEEDGSLHIDSARKGAEHLQTDGVEDREGDIGLANVAGQQVLNVSFGKDTAARCNRVDVLSLLCEGVELAGLDVQQTGGLVNESTCAASAVSIHADVGHSVSVEENHLAVLAADVDEGAGFRK